MDKIETNIEFMNLFVALLHFVANRNTCRWSILYDQWDENFDQKKKLTWLMLDDPNKPIIFL